MSASFAWFRAVSRPAPWVPASVRLGFALFVLLTAGAPAGTPAEARSISSRADQPGKPVRRAKAANPLAALDGTERKVVAAVDRGVPASLALLERSVDVNSGTLNLEGVRETARLFEPELAALGFTTEWVDGTAWGRAGHLVARRVPAGGAGSNDSPRMRPGIRELKGATPASSTPSPGPVRVLLIGHLDTVFEKDSPFQRYERLSDSTARGPGITDMKGGNVVMLLALRGLKEAGALDRLALTVVLSGDEEKPGTPIGAARRDLTAAADWADVAIGFEDGDGDPRTAVVARRGSSGWRLEVEAKPSHSSQIFREDIGPGAIFEASRLLEAFRDSLAGMPFLTFSPGTILGGTTVDFDSAASRGTAFGKTNVVAEHALVNGDLRALSLEQRSTARATMTRIAAAGPPHTHATLTFSEGYPPLAPSDGNRRLLAIYEGASRDLGLGSVSEVDPMRAGAADVSFCEGRVEMALDGVGLMGEGGHTVDEVADLRTLPSQAKRVALTLLRLAEGWKKR